MREEYTPRSNNSDAQESPEAFHQPSPEELYGLLPQPYEEQPFETTRQTEVDTNERIRARVLAQVNAIAPAKYVKTPKGTLVPIPVIQASALHSDLKISPRQQEVLDAVDGQGLSYEAAGRLLRMSTNTVGKYLLTLRKMGVRQITGKRHNHAPKSGQTKALPTDELDTSST